MSSASTSASVFDVVVDWRVLRGLGRVDGDSEVYSKFVGGFALFRVVRATGKYFAEERVLRITRSIVRAVPCRRERRILLKSTKACIGVNI